MKTCTETPRCWNCKHLSYVYYTGKFSCRARGLRLPRRLINQFPIDSCPCHEFCSKCGIAKRKDAGWHLVPTPEDEMNRFAPKISYLKRRVNPGRTIRRSKAVTFKGMTAAVDARDSIPPE